jgi:hypothetical protein
LELATKEFDCKRRSFCLFLFCVGLESKEHNTFWESKRNSKAKAKQSKAKERNKAAAAAPPGFSQVFWVLPTFSLLGGEILASWPKQSKAKVKYYSVVPCLCLVFFFFFHNFFLKITFYFNFKILKLDDKSGGEIWVLKKFHSLFQYLKSLLWSSLCFSFFFKILF